MVLRNFVSLDQSRQRGLIEFALFGKEHSHLRLLWSIDLEAKPNFVIGVEGYTHLWVSITLYRYDSLLQGGKPCQITEEEKTNQRYTKTNSKINADTTCVSLRGKKAIGYCMTWTL
jgi:hypothetical protein